MTKYGVQASFFLSQLLRSNFIHGLCLDEKQETGANVLCLETLLLLRVWKQLTSAGLALFRSTGIF